LVRRAVARWPDNAPHPASKVRDRLAGLDTLAEARRILTSAADPHGDPPQDIEALSGALDTVIQDGDDTDGLRLLALLDSGRIAAVVDRVDAAQANRLVRKLGAALRWLLPAGAHHPQYPPAVERLNALLADQS
jgi:hypothetical protein